MAMVLKPKGNMILSHDLTLKYPPAAVAKLFQSCLTLCDPIGGSPPGSSIPGILHGGYCSGTPLQYSCLGNPMDRGAS